MRVKARESKSESESKREKVRMRARESKSKSESNQERVRARVTERECHDTDGDGV